MPEKICQYWQYLLLINNLSYYCIVSIFLLRVSEKNLNFVIWCSNQFILEKNI